MSKVMFWLPLAGIFFCGVFFWYVFTETRPKDNVMVPTVNVTVASGVDATAVTNNVFFSKSYQEKLEKILRERESIVAAEHERFRGDLGTWLSIFGLLAILATIMVAALSYTCQQVSLKEERAGIREELERMKAEIRALALSEQKAFSSDASQVNGVRKFELLGGDGSQMTDDQNVSVVENSSETDFESAQNECKKFVKMWPTVSGNTKSPEEMFAEKVEAGIKVLCQYNELLLKSQGPETKEMLEKMHLISIYLGQVRETDFYRLFVSALKERRPLTLANEVILDKLESCDCNKAMIAGYYRHLYGLQV